MKAPPVAAVYDRRPAPDAHRAPLQKTAPAASVYDRRTDLPALIEHRYKTSVLALLLSILLPAFGVAAPKNDPLPAVKPSIGYNTTAQVERGGTCEILVRGVVMPRDTAEVQIRKGPAHGTLEGPRKVGHDTSLFLYRHNGSRHRASDRVEFKIKTSPMNAWSPVSATIAILEPPNRLEISPGTLDFGEVPIGDTRTLPLQIRNGGGGILTGTLVAGSPWSFEGPAGFELAEGRAAELRVVFTPDGPGTREGRIELETNSAPDHVSVRGEGVFRFDSPDRVAFENKPGSDAMEFLLTNRSKTELPLSIDPPPPLTASGSITLPPEGSAPLRLGVEKRHYTEKSVEMKISDGTAARTVRVGLPPPPAFLEWASANGMHDLGDIPPRNIPRPEFELRNRGATAATVEIREGEGGLAPAGSQARTFDLQPGEAAIVKTVWSLDEKRRGNVAATLLASHGGLDHALRVQANIIEPQAPSEESPAESASSPVPEPTPPQVQVLTEQERKELALRLPRDIAYRLTPAGRLADAVVTWKYEGPEPVLFLVEKKVVQRAKADLGDAFERRLKVPDELPKPETVVKWVPAVIGEGSIQRLDDGSWEGAVAGLEPGYHELRIATRAPPEGQRIDYSSFVVRVDPLPPNPLWNWLAGGLGIFCLLYLLRKKIRRWFGRPLEN